MIEEDDTFETVLLAFQKGAFVARKINRSECNRIITLKTGECQRLSVARLKERKLFRKYMKNPPSACSSLGLKSEENYVDYRYTYSKKQGMTA